MYHPLLCNFACVLPFQGLGMNQDELARNKQLTEYSVRDLNSDPKLPYEDSSFDVITNCVSVDYLTQPLEVSCSSGLNPACKGTGYYAPWQVFKEMHLLLKPGTENNFSRSSQKSLQSFKETCSPFCSLQVFKEMHRVLKPGGTAIMSFSNRCFPTKAISVWTQTGDEDHIW